MQLIKEKSFYKNLFALAIPIVLQNLVTYSVTLADNLMIGSLGDVAVSGVYMGGQIQTILQVAGAGIEAAVLLLSAQYWGRRDTGSIRKIVKLGMSFSLLLGAIVTAVCAITPRGVIGFFADSGAVVESGAEYLSIVCWSYLFFCTTQALIASMRAVEEHMARIGWPGKVVPSDENEGILRLKYDIKGEPLVSVILCGKNGAQNCRASIHTDYKNIEYITIDAENRYAAMNRAAKEAKGEILLFIDSSAAAKKGDLITELLMYAQRGDVGAVTPVIWDTHGCVSHAGFAVGMKGGAICREQGLSVLVGGWHLLMCKVHNVSALSAACLMVRKDHFIPFDERFSEGLGAVDWCLRMQKAGYRHVFTPHASLICQNRVLLLTGFGRDKNDLALYTSIHGEHIHDGCYSEYFARNIASGRTRRDLSHADLRPR